MRKKRTRKLVPAWGECLKAESGRGHLFQSPTNTPPWWCIYCEGAPNPASPPHEPKTCVCRPCSIRRADRAPATSGPAGGGT